MSKETERMELRSGFTAHIEEDFLAEIETDLTLEELDEWVSTFLRERVT